MSYFSYKNGLALVLAGGRSERLFPLSQPKPLLEVQGRSLLDSCLARLAKFSEIRVVCNSEVARAIRKYREEKKLPPLKFVLEPEARDTAAAVGFALRKIEAQKFKWLGVFSADQYYPDEKKFALFLDDLLRELNAHPESLFLAGSPAKMKEPQAHSQFGWMLTEKSSKRSSKLKRFVEKPTGQKLKNLRDAGGLINCGMFFGSLNCFLKAYQEFYPKVLQIKFPFHKLEKQPIDRAIFEKWKNTRALRMNLRWEDVGTWEVLSSFEKSQNFFTSGAEGSFVRGFKGKKVYIFGNEPFLLVEAKDRVLVMPLKESVEMKKWIKQIKLQGS